MAGFWDMLPAQQRFRLAQLGVDTGPAPDAPPDMPTLGDYGRAGIPFVSPFAQMGDAFLRNAAASNFAANPPPAPSQYRGAQYGVDTGPAPQTPPAAEQSLAGMMPGKGLFDLMAAGVPVIDPTTGRPDPRYTQASTNAAIGLIGGGAGMAPEGALGATGGRLSGRYIRPDEMPALDVHDRPPNRMVQVGIRDPQRMFSPGIYKDPRDIAAMAAQQLAPEHPALKELFGVTRDDLAQIGQMGTRPGNMPPQINAPANARGSYVAENIMTPRNAQRLIDANVEAQKASPALTNAMDAWYVMDPMYWRMRQLFGPEEAAQRYSRLNTLTSMASPGSEVLTEINRGTAAHMMAQQGRFADFVKYGGMAEGSRGIPDFPPELRDVISHPYHKTSQALPMQNYLNAGAVDMTSPKVPLYMQASGVPETGFQTTLPVPDAHWTRAIGAADVRTNANPGASMRMTEYPQAGNWFRENVAKPLGLEAVPAQARTWGVFSPQTGVTSPIGAPKLELFSQRIWERAQQLGIDPKMLRDMVLRGEQHAQLQPTGAMG